MLDQASLMPGASSPLGRSLQQLAESVSSYLDVDGKKVSGLNNAGWIWMVREGFFKKQELQ